MDTTSIILAVASPPGRSLRGIIRISGAGALDLVRAATVRERCLPPRIATPTSIHLLGLPVPVLAAPFPGPRSYTGEDSVEMYLPGNPVLLDRVIEALVEVGRSMQLHVRRAEAGEFTARAFLNGRISLSEAEGVAATIAARSDAELRAARVLTSGRLGTLAEALSDSLAGVLALVEAGIDFTDEEDVVAITPDDLCAQVKIVLNRLDDLLRTAVGSEALEATPWVVLSGAPNAGKSTLFNAMLGHERAVVSPLAGTTRDVITEPLRIPTGRGDAEVMLVDLAGVDPSLDVMNLRMQAAAADATRRAELILRCVPANAPETERRDVDAREVLVLTKCDVAEGPATREPEAIRVSALTGAGLDKLRNAIAHRLADRAVSLAADSMVLNTRHADALKNARAALAEALEHANAEPDRPAHLRQPELVAASIRAALDRLGAIAGQITPDDILGRVFATFCVGK